MISTLARMKGGLFLMVVACLTLAVNGCVMVNPESIPPSAKKAGVKPPVDSPAPAPKLSGSLEIDKATIQVKASLEPGGKAGWSEKKGRADREFSGKWRQEGDDILMLLSSKSGEQLSVVLSKAGDKFKVLQYGTHTFTNQQLLSP